MEIIDGCADDDEYDDGDEHCKWYGPFLTAKSAADGSDGTPIEAGMI